MAELSVKIINKPNNKRRRMGASQNFLRTFIKSHNSLNIDILLAYTPPMYFFLNPIIHILNSFLNFIFKTVSHIAFYQILLCLS